MKKYGLFIGVNKYNRVKPHLKGAEADARLLAGIFAERLGFTTSVLTDEQLGYGDSVGSQDRIFEQLEEFREKLSADGGGVLVVYFAGHGITNEKGEQFLLVPKAPEYALSRPKAGTMGVFSEETLCAATDNWPGVKRAFIFDACRTSENRRPMAEGEVGGRLGMAVPRREGEEMPEDLVILRACPSDQIACELKNYGEKEDKKDHGLFSAALLEVICQKADVESPVVLDGELSQKLGREMHRLAKEYIKDAAPEMKGQALAQHPEFHGGRLRLIDKGDYRKLKIKRLRDKFDQQLAAGNLSDPPGVSCRDILIQLAQSNLEQGVLANLSGQLQAAEQEKCKQAECQKEEKLIEMARRLGTPEAYAKYLQDSPLYKYEAEAEGVIRVAREYADEDDWSEAQSQNSLAGYRRYLSKHPHPHGLHAQEARQIFERMEREAAREKEQSEWEQVRDGSLEELRAFRVSWPVGHLVDEADAAITRLEGEEVLWSKCCEVDTAESFQHYLDVSELQSYASEARERLDEKIKQSLAKVADQVLWDAVSGDLAKLEAASDQWRTDEHRLKAQEKISELEQNARYAREEALWSDCASYDTEASYKRYLSKSKLHRYEAEAKERLAGKVKQREDTQADQELWKKMSSSLVRLGTASGPVLWKKMSGSLVKLEAASGQWRTDEYRLKAQEKIGELRQAEERGLQEQSAREEKLWTECSEEDTEEGYQCYLDESELLRYEAEARERLNGAKKKREENLWSTCREADTEASYQCYLDKSELRRHETDARKRLTEKVKLKEDVKADQALWKKVSGNLAKLKVASDQWLTYEYRLKAQGKIGELRQAEERELQEQAAREEKLWSECRDEDSEGSYHRYLQNSELQRYDTEAKACWSVKKNEREETLWATCRKGATEASYQCYLDKSELRRYESEARKLLAEKVKQRDAEEADQALWKKVFSSRAKLEEAGRQWRTDEYRLKAKEKVGKLEQVERNKKEETLWSECREQDTEASYQRYLKNSELQRYEGEAKNRLVAKEEEGKQIEVDHTLWLAVYGDIAKLGAASGEWKTKEYRDKARDRIADFEQQAAREAQEESLWAECRKSDSSWSYERYLAENVLRRHEAEARKRLAAIAEELKKHRARQRKVAGVIGGLAVLVMLGVNIPLLYRSWTKPTPAPPSLEETTAPSSPTVSPMDSTPSSKREEYIHANLGIAQILHLDDDVKTLRVPMSDKELANILVQSYAKILGGDFRDQDAVTRHQAAWKNLEELGDASRFGQYSSIASMELDNYSARTEHLDKELRGLSKDPARQAKEKHWPEYQFRLTLRADRGDSTAASILGVILDSQGKTVPAFHMMLRAASGKDQAVRQQAGINLRNYLEKLMESENKQQARVLLPELKKMVGSGAGPDWQLWLARYYETLGESNSACALYQPLATGTDRNIAAFAATGLKRLGN